MGCQCTDRGAVFFGFFWEAHPEGRWGLPRFLRGLLRTLLVSGAAVFAWPGAGIGDELEQGFAEPPSSAKPWVYWFWINGNISREGITADLEALQQAGVGGVLWMEVSGPWWAPDGPVTGLSPAWHEAMQWAFRECARLGLEFDLSVDFGYGSGGPHITPERSMQKLYWSETEIAGGGRVDVMLPRPEVDRKNLSAWLRPGAGIRAEVLEQIERSDSYRDVAVLAIPAPTSDAGRKFRVPELGVKDGTSSRLPKQAGVPAAPADAVTPLDRVVDLTALMQADGRLAWDAPPGSWLVLRCGHASNFKMTRPCPTAAIGLECDRLAQAGIDTHYERFLKPLFLGAGDAAGRALSHVHIDSWEAGGQNWTASFPAEFRARRGYDPRPWLPVLAGRVIGDAGLSERFLWDMRKTVSELIRDNYARRLRELALPHGIRLSVEAYGNLCIDQMDYAGVADFPICEFWARGEGHFPQAGGHEGTARGMASAAHTGGRPIVGAEAFTSDRGWRDHPYLLKGMGDQKFCEGVNRMIFHLTAHQAYEGMIPGLTHRRWGEHFHRFNTWWPYVEPWMDYLTRCQFLLQQGRFVADICCCLGEGAPLNVEELRLEMPAGYEYDLCSAEGLLQARAREGQMHLPSGASYRYLYLPETGRLSPGLARKVRELVEGGVRVVAGPRPTGAPGLSGYPACDAEVESLAAELWDGRRVIAHEALREVLAREKLAPDFEGEGLRFLHRRAGEADIYLVAHGQPLPRRVACRFRVAGKRPELWDPESGEIRNLPEYEEKDGRSTVWLQFEPMQSWFVVFRQPSGAKGTAGPGQRNFEDLREAGLVPGPWEVSFDPRWGGPVEPVPFRELSDWSRHPDSRIHYYSGTAIYRTAWEQPSGPAPREALFLDLGAVEVVARVKVNGIDCGIAWKPPYRAGISRALRPGRNELEISVANLWINRMVGDEQLPLDGQWKDFETLLAWPDWFIRGEPRPSGRFTFSSCRHYGKSTPLAPSGLLGPVRLLGRPAQE